MRIKTLLLLLLVTGTVFSQTPDNKVYKQDVIQSGWIYSPSEGKNVPTYDTTVLLKPTWSQAINYAYQRPDNTIYLILGIILLVGLVMYGNELIALANKPGTGNVFLGYGAIFVVLILAIQCFFGNAYGVKWNNDKWISKKSYDYHMQKDSTTKPIWDSLAANYLIIDGPYPKK